MAAELPTPPLTLPPDQMRQLGYQAVDLVVDTLDGLRDRAPSRRARPEELAGLLNEPVPRTGADPGEVLRQAARRCSGRPCGSTIRASSPTCRSPATTSACWPTPSPRGSGCSRGPGRRPRARPRPSWPREVNFTDRGLQLTRSFRAFKLWLSLKVLGLDAFAAAVQHGMDLAGYADALLRRRSGWEVVAPTRLALVSFCHADRSRTPGELEAANRRVADAMLVDELATLSSTVLGGRTVLRLCTVNPRTTREDAEATLARVEELARSG